MKKIFLSPSAAARVDRAAAWPGSASADALLVSSQAKQRYRFMPATDGDGRNALGGFDADNL
jgi:hypothetical protein